jgi:hypothetical protein
VRQSYDRTNAADKKDAEFVLNWGGISTNQSYKVIQSYVSARNLTGDHLDFYCIELQKFEVAETSTDQWKNGPEADPLLAEALQLAPEDAHQHGACFPTTDQANSRNMKIMFWSVTAHGRYPTAADILLYDTDSRKLYYVGFKT